MTLLRDADALIEARREGRALAAFTVYNLEQIQGVLRAAARERTPTILMAGSSAFGYAGRSELIALAMAAAEASEQAVGVHLDHSTDLAEIRDCLDAGYSSVMIDGSALTFEQNVELTRTAAKLAHAAGAWLEGELTGVAGAEDASEAVTACEYTDPTLAADFVARTGVNALAVSVGNVHGMADPAVTLDLERLARIAEQVEIPLVLHGASGLPPRDIAPAIRLGVAKLNVNTELRRAFREGLRQSLGAPPSGDDLAGVLRPAVEAVCATAQTKIRQYARPAQMLEGEPREGQSAALGTPSTSRLPLEHHGS